MNCWQHLALEPTSDLRAIKKAYAKQLKLIDPETEMAAFIALREALNEAQFEASYFDLNLDENDQLDASEVQHLNAATEPAANAAIAATAATDLTLVIEAKYQDLAQQIEQQNIHFKFQDALSELRQLIEQLADTTQQQSQIEAIQSLLSRHGLEDFASLLQPSTASLAAEQRFTPLAQEQYSATATESPYLLTELSDGGGESDADASDFDEALERLSQALWDQHIDETVFADFQQLLAQLEQLSLQQQFTLKDQLLGPLAELELDLNPLLLQRFIALWLAYFPEDEHQYADNYYAR